MRRNHRGTVETVKARSFLPCPLHFIEDAHGQNILIRNAHVITLDDRRLACCRLRDIAISGIGSPPSARSPAGFLPDETIDATRPRGPPRVLQRPHPRRHDSAARLGRGPAAGPLVQRADLGGRERADRGGRLLGRRAGRLRDDPRRHGGLRGPLLLDGPGRPGGGRVRPEGPAGLVRLRPGRQPGDRRDHAGAHRRFRQANSTAAPADASAPSWARTRPTSARPSSSLAWPRKSERLGVGVHIHLSESRQQFDASLAKHGKSPVALVADLGLLDRPSLARTASTCRTRIWTSSPPRAPAWRTVPRPT